MYFCSLIDIAGGLMNVYNSKSLAGDPLKPTSVSCFFVIKIARRFFRS
jgi:hypothetical protein